MITWDTVFPFWDSLSDLQQTDIKTDFKSSTVTPSTKIFFSPILTHTFLIFFIPTSLRVDPDVADVGLGELRRDGRKLYP